MSTKENMEATESQYLNVEKSAQYTPFSEAFIKRKMRNGEIRAFKVGKTWITTKAYLDEFIANGKGNGKGQMEEKTKDRIRYQASLRSRESIHKNFKEMEENILKIKKDLETEDKFKKIALTERLRTAVGVREDTKMKEANMPAYLNNLANKAYSDVADLVNHDPDTLEQMFIDEANGTQENKNANVMEAGATDNPDGATIVEVHIDDEDE